MANLPILTGLALGGLASGLLLWHHGRKKALAHAKGSSKTKKDAGPRP